MRDSAHFYSAVIWLIVLSFIGYKSYRNLEHAMEGFNIQIKTMDDFVNGNP